MGEQGAKRHNSDRDWSDVSLPEVYRSKYIDCICARGYDHCRDHGKQNVECAFLPLQCSAF